MLEQDQDPSFISEASALNPERHESCSRPARVFLLHDQSLLPVSDIASL
jgi:hypothetical protein